MKNSNLRRMQLDSCLSSFGHQIGQRPKSGWIAEIRKALVMTSSQLAKRLGIDQSTLSRIEQSEAKNTITLESLIRAADALGCDLRYVLVPKKPLEAMWLERAKQKLRKEDNILQHTLALEEQTDYANQPREEVRITILGQKLGSKIWDED